MSLMSAGRLASLSRTLDRTLAHTCTITPNIDGATDSENNDASVPGVPQTAVPCRFETIQRAIRDQGGVTLVTVPALSVSASLAVSIGSRVTAIVDQLGGTPPGAAGAFRIERVLDDTAGFGAAILPSYELRAAGVG